jgi:hypothetical protein
MQMLQQLSKMDHRQMAPKPRRNDTQPLAAESNKTDLTFDWINLGTGHKAMSTQMQKSRLRFGPHSRWTLPKLFFGESRFFLAETRTRPAGRARHARRPLDLTKSRKRRENVAKILRKRRENVAKSSSK